MQALQNAPLWVWPLLALLLGLGVMQMRGRTYSRARLLLLPATMIALSAASTLGSFGPRPGAIGVWAVTALALVAANETLIKWPRGAAVTADGAGYLVPGSIVPLILILGIFCVRFYIGMTGAIDPKRLQDPSFIAAVCAALGVFSGAFLARALRILRGEQQAA